MTDEQLLEKVKEGLRAGDSNNGTLLIKTIAVKEYMLGAGISQELIESSLGIATLTIGVSDLWSLQAGEIKFSDAFKDMLMPQLMARSIGV